MRKLVVVALLVGAFALPASAETCETATIDWSYGPGSPKKTGGSTALSLIGSWVVWGTSDVDASSANIPQGSSTVTVCPASGEVSFGAVAPVSVAPVPVVDSLDLAGFDSTPRLVVGFF